ncbi:hypothetical protein BROUX41_004533 [Berkeleyomyces rouxiae]|uniref:uncharacterized protein n=1 Tax=Berkeleyomyces rouxiae TaxID=2035830 RepID=UPI003B80E647
MNNQKSQPPALSLWCKATAVAMIFSHRITRGGPRLLTAAVVSLLVVTLYLTRFAMPETSLSSLTRPLYDSWQPADDDEASSPDGGLRIVVFGTPDVATVIEGTAGKQEKSWTEKLCEELRCSEHLSYVPKTNSSHGQGVDAALTSNKLWQHVLDTVAANKPDSNAPGHDYTFVKEQYPMPSHPDLMDQITSFISIPQPKTNPKETLWVLNFGTWDIWYLSALPRDLATHYIDSLVLRIFSQLDFLYQEALNERSIAFSDFWLYSPDELIDKTHEPLADWKPQEMESFRVLLPQLFDISITPGWNAARPAPPSPHSKAEQDRNALFLTNRWNEMIAKRISEWNAKSSPKSEQEYENMLEEESYIKLKVASDKKKDNKKKDDKKDKRSSVETQVISDRDVVALYAELTERSADQLAKQAAASAKRSHGKIQKRWRHSAHVSPDVEPIMAPLPRCTAAQFDGQIFISEAIIEQQFRVRNISDHLGRGVRPDTDLAVFDNVNKPCVSGESSPLHQKVCSNPNDYLFFSLFTVSQPAINVIANRASVIVYDTLLLQKPGTTKNASESSEKAGGTAAAGEITHNPADAATSHTV